MLFWHPYCPPCLDIMCINVYLWYINSLWSGLIFSTWAHLHGSISTFLNALLADYTSSLIKLLSYSAAISLWICTTTVEWNGNTCGNMGKKNKKKQINFLPYHRFIGFQKRWALSTEIDFLVLHYGNENTVGLLVNGVDLPLPMFILRLLLFLSEMEGVYIMETSLGFLRGHSHCSCLIM